MCVAHENRSSGVPAFSLLAIGRQRRHIFWPIWGVRRRGGAQSATTATNMYYAGWHIISAARILRARLPCLKYNGEAFCDDICASRPRGPPRALTMPLSAPIFRFARTNPPTLRTQSPVSAGGCPRILHSWGSNSYKFGDLE